MEALAMHAWPIRFQPVGTNVYYKPQTERWRCRFRRCPPAPEPENDTRKARAVLYVLSLLVPSLAALIVIYLIQRALRSAPASSTTASAVPLASSVSDGRVRASVAFATPPASLAKASTVGALPKASLARSSTLDALAHNGKVSSSLAATAAELKAALAARPLLAAQIDLADTAMLGRFLVARKRDVAATVAMLEAHAAWRERTLPIALPEVASELRKGKAYLHGADAQGRPLVFVNSRNFDPKTRDLDQAVRAAVYMMEQAARATDGQFVIFYDRTGFSLGKNLDVPFLKAIVTTLSANYPERLGAVYVYPAGAVVNAIWKVLAPLMDERTRDKVQLLTSDARLKERVPPEYLPPRYGGTSAYAFDPSAYGAGPAGPAPAAK